MMINRKVLLILCFLSYGDAQRLRKGGQNVCTKYKTINTQEKYCAYNTWQACCYWLYRTTCRYEEETYCCNGYRQRGSECPIPICSTNCGGSSRGTCIAPETCRCNTGYTRHNCEGETCSAVKPCYPGVCRTSYGSANCYCNDGFTRTNTNEGCTTLLKEPAITNAFATLSFYHTMKQMDIYNLSVDASATSNSNNNYIWTNMKKFNTLTADMSSILNLPTLPGKPPYISTSETNIGISSAYVTILHSKARRKRGLTKRSTSSTTLSCVNTKTDRQISNANPEASLLTCSQMKASNLTQRVDSGDEITLTFTGLSGGQEAILDGPTYNFTGKRAEVKVHFKVDHDSPTPPRNKPDIFHVAEEITKGPSIRTSWQGWTDTLSGMYRYNWEIFRLEKKANELREEGQEYLSPIHSFNIDHNGSRTYIYNYTPSQSGVYSMILEASDRANNSIYIRRFVIFDNTSDITTTSTPLKVLSGNADADYKWQTWTQGRTNDIIFSWEGHFINKLHKDGGFLGSINDYPPQLNDMNIPPGNIFKKTIDKLLTDPSSKRNQTAIPNVNGITSFEVAKTTKEGRPSFIEKGLQQTHTFSEGSITDGTFVKLWAKASDIMGNTKTSTLLLGFDRTPPSLNETTIRRNIGNSFTYTSTLHFKTYDVHSGVKQIDFKIIEKATGTETKSGIIPAATSQNEPISYLGYTLDDGSNFLYEHNFPLNNCWLTPSRDDVQSESFELQLTVKNRAGLTTDQRIQIGNLTIFKGIGTYQGINNLTVTSKENTVTLKWQFVDSCYQRRSLLLKYWGPDGNENGKRVAKDATEFDISNLQPSTTYNASLLIKYDGVNSDEKWLSFTTKNIVVPPSALTTGSKIGIGAGIFLFLILILIIVIMAVMMRRGKLKRVNQALAPIMQPISRTIRRKSRSSYSKYEMGGYDKDDIYMYGGITYERTPDWQHDPDQLSIGGLIQVGRFARIYNATVKTGRKSKHVAAKVLKDEFNEEDSILMKAKINFFATKVGKHPCVMGFEGAVMDHPDFGRVMILELCQGGTMKDWLIENKERADDEIIERLFRFSFDIARGMEYLAEKEILHMRLAARNVLLTGNIEAKVAGFGPRHGESEDDDRTSRKERIPIKWIAPECLDKPNSASEKSDVWSFGITIWEIFSMGQTPYGNVKSKDLKKWLKKGNKLQKPEYSDDTHYEIMKECWDFDPVMRPPFSNIHRKIESLFRQSSGDVYYYDR